MPWEASCPSRCSPPLWTTRPWPGRRSSPGARPAGRHHRPDRDAAGGRRDAGRGRPQRAGGHRDHPRGRGPGGRVGRPAAGRPGRGVSGLGDAAARAPVPAQRHRRAAPGRAAAAGPPAGPRVRCGSSSPRSGRSCSRSCEPGRPGAGGTPPGQTADLDAVVRRLADIAYARADLVTRRGEFAVRGGILDVFPPTDEHPVRVEFWGDEVEEIRTFAVADQRTLAPVERMWAPACRELLLTDDVRARARELARSTRSWSRCWTSWPRGSRSRAWSRSRRRCWTGAIAGAGARLHAGRTVVLLCDPERIRGRAHDLVRTSEEFLQASWAAAAGGGKAPVDLGAAAFRTLSEVRRDRRPARSGRGGRSARSGWPSRPVRSGPWTNRGGEPGGCPARREPGPRARR